MIRRNIIFPYVLSLKFMISGWTKKRVPLEFQGLMHVNDLLCHLINVFVEFNHECSRSLALRVHCQSFPLFDDGI